jgi:hypothetical protein
MRRAFALVVLLSSLTLLAPAAAAETVKGTIRKVDEKASTISFARDGTRKEEVLAVDRSVKLKDVRANAKAEITIDGGVVKEIKPAPRTGGY